MLQAALRSHSSKLGRMSSHRPEGARDSANQRPSTVTQTATGRGSRSYQSEAGKIADGLYISSTILAVSTTVHCNTLSLRMHKRPKLRVVVCKGHSWRVESYSLSGGRQLTSSTVSSCVRGSCAGAGVSLKDRRGVLLDSGAWSVL